ncbi:hypothetical protein SAMN06298216_3566 [Spirosomataceae bacterium TFI 002]|nr:hypothetical protein SAMN06298216_3566 [Spirosomataceae bacterium TFI 002]
MFEWISIDPQNHTLHGVEVCPKTAMGFGELSIIVVG